MAMAVILATLLGLFLTGIFILLPNQTQDQMPIPRPSPSVLEQISWAMLWIGLAALIALIIVSVIMLINRVIRKERSEDLEAQKLAIESEPGNIKDTQSVGES
jgi:uncharacterized membrane protein